MTYKEQNENLNMLLNAYLDDQLSPAKAEKVEKLLAEDSDAREMLAQLRAVSTMVNSLPRCQAPQDLAEGVIMFLERDLLLDKSEILAELAGKKHLRLRRFIEAAAMILLVSALVMVVFNVLRDPQLTPASQTDGDVIDIALADKAAPVALNEVVPEQPAPEVADFTLKDMPSKAGQYSSVNLVVKTNTAQADWDTLAQLLDGQSIDDIVHTSIDENHRQYAFLCSMAQLRNVFNDLRWTSDSNIDMVLTDKTQARRIIVTDITETELMALAQEANPRLQLVNAMQIAPADRIDMRDENTQSETELMELFAKAQPELTELRLLGPSQSSPRLAKKPETPSSTITANTTQPAENDLSLGTKTDSSTGTPQDSPAEKSIPAQTVAVVLIVQFEETQPQQPQSTLLELPLTE